MKQYSITELLALPEYTVVSDNYGNEWIRAWFGFVLATDSQRRISVYDITEYGPIRQVTQ